GNVYVAAGNYSIRKITAAGEVTTLPNPPGTYLYTPGGVAVDSAGNVYVADTGNAAIRKITAAGVMTTLAGAAGLSGSTDGVGTAARIGDAHGLAVSSAGNIYVADSVRIRRATLTGALTTFVGSSSGSMDGTGAGAQFYSPRGVAVDGTGNIYVA